MRTKGRGSDDIKTGAAAGPSCLPRLWLPRDSQGKQAPRAVAGDTSCALFLLGLRTIQSALIRLG